MKAIIFMVLLISLAMLVPAFAKNTRIYTDDDLGNYSHVDTDEKQRAPESQPINDLEKTFIDMLGQYNREIKNSHGMWEFHMKNHKEAVNKKYFGLARDQMQEAEEYTKRMEAHRVIVWVN